MKITTWNMRGGAQQLYLQTLIAQNDPDVICLQECGDMSQILENQAPILGHPYSLTGKYRSGSVLYDVLFWCNYAEADPRNSLAVMSRLPVHSQGILDPVDVSPLGFQPHNPRRLPWMEVNEGGVSIAIYSYHAPSANVSKVCSYTNMQIAALHRHPGVRAVVGDFNADPTNEAFVAPPTGTVVRGEKATRQGGNLMDYSITTPFVYYIFHRAGRLVGASEHYPQSFMY
ncbi:MAG: endonuclease/exonuclease/phosphatase family protein [Cyanobacteriota bacterium]|jgi:endonuclease/exonuclease/phosphatase family metal-dependent hydrolase